MRSIKRFSVSVGTCLSVFILVLAGSSTALAGSAANPAGQTIIPSNACAADLLGKKMSCTSQDITIADARLVSENFPIPTSCIAGGTVLVEFEVDIQMNANADRFDPLLFVALTEADITLPAADPVNNPNLCWLSSLSDIDDSPFLLDLEATEAYGENVVAPANDQDALDSCPDVTNDGSDPVIVQRMSTTMQAELPCIDTDGDGFMNFQAMITWTTGADTISQCGSGDGVLDPTEFGGQTSKCSTNIGNSIALEIIDPASLTVVKNTTQDGAFTFTTTGFDPASVFSNGSDSFVLNTIAGTASLTDADIDVPVGGLGFSVAETVPPGFELTSAVCSNAQDPAALTLFPGDDVTCTFVNAAEGSVTIVKNTIGTDGDQFSFTSDLPDGDFNITTSGFTGQHVESQAVPAGTYTVTEADPFLVGDGYDLTSVSCVDGTGDSVGDVDTRSATIVVEAQDTITCTFVNTAQGTIIVEKSTFPDTATDTFNFTGDAAGDIGDGQQIVVSNLVPGTYSSTETLPAGWDLTQISCDDGNSSGDTGSGEATFNLEAGETVTCTFTNTQRGSIEVVKQVLPVGANTQAFTMNAGGGFFFDGVGGSQVATDLTPASDLANATTGAIEVLPASLYTVSETMPVGWFEAATPTCNNGSDPLTGIEVQPGEAVVCTFVNNAYGNIIVDKVTDPVGSPQSFTFTPSYGADFNLTDADTPNDSGDLVPGQYSVTEALPAGWLATSATCDNGDTPDAITLDAGETVTCTFTNTQQSNIIVDKVTDPVASPQSFEFTPSYGAVFNLTDAAAPNDSGLLDPGAYSVVESAVNGWIQTSATCDNGDSPGAITLDAGETVTCTFTNTQQSNIIVDKVTDPAASPQSFEFTPSYGAVFNLTDAAAPNDSGLLDPGAYSVVESAVSGWILTSATCDNGDSPGAITLDAGETVTCTFNNSVERSAIIVDKVTDPAGSTQLFTFTPSYGDAFMLADTDTPNYSGELLPSSEAGTYSVSETVPAGWIQTSATCTGDGNTPAAITVLPGETVTCTFTNTQQGEIVVVKNTVGGDGAFDFTSATLGGFQITTAANTGQESFANLDLGVYDVAEATPPAGWNMTSATCDNQDDPSAITLGAGETVTCTFVNEEDPSLTIVKQVVGGSAVATDFVLTLTGADGYHDAGVDYSHASSPILEAGIVYSLTETPDQVMHYVDTGVVCVDDSDQSSLAHPITLEAGQDATCTLTNLYQPPPPDKPLVPVPVNNPVALLLLTLMMLATGWYFRPAVMRKF